MTRQPDHNKVSLKKRIAEESAIFAKSIHLTDKETHEGVTMDLASIVECAYFGVSPLLTLDIGFVAIELYAHYGLSIKAGEAVATRIASKLGMRIWE